MWLDKTYTALGYCSFSNPLWTAQSNFQTSEIGIVEWCTSCLSVKYQYLKVQQHLMHDFIPDCKYILVSKREDWERLLTTFKRILRQVSRGWGKTHFCGAQWQDKGQWAQSEMQKVPVSMWWKISLLWGDRALEKASQRGCGVFSGDTQKPAKMSSCATCSGWTSFSRDFTLDNV